MKPRRAPRELAGGSPTSGYGDGYGSGSGSGYGYGSVRLSRRRRP